ncbi:MAG: uppS [Burkholderiales bacterium]|nr:uppS [Burkholderiales bacterium]
MSHASSTREIPGAGDVPRHVAIIMDGNGRWAKGRRLPRIAGHRRGVDAVRATVRGCAERGIEFLTLFAFSSENWRRPAEEVALLMQLFQAALSNEVEKLHKSGVRLKVVGDTTRFDPKIRRLIQQGEHLTADNRQLTLTVAANYGGRWDIMQALSKLMKEKGSLNEVQEEMLSPYLAMSYAPEPDLFIRTGGEQRISNFLLWQLAYTELSYRRRERRFGRTSDQLQDAKRAEVA